MIFYGNFSMGDDAYRIRIKNKPWRNVPFTFLLKIAVQILIIIANNLIVDKEHSNVYSEV